MPGFGSGPFGYDPFGEWGWSRTVLYETTPEVYRNAQTPESDFLRRYTKGQQPSFDNIRHHIQYYGDLRDPFRARSSTSDAEFLILGKQVQPTSSTEQAGNLGRVNSAGTFTAGDRTAFFRTSDIGKQIYIRRSNVAANNQQYFTITSVISSKEVFTDPLVSVDAGPVRWELRTVDPLPEGQVEVEIRGGDPRRIELGWSVNDGSKSYDVVSRQMFYQPVANKRLLTEREGTDGYIVPSTARLYLSGLTPSAVGTFYAPYINTVLQATTAGLAGNGIRLKFINSGAGTGTLTAVDNDFTFAYQSGVTTPANFEAAVAAFTGAPFFVYQANTAALGALTHPYCTFDFVPLSGGGLQLLSNGTYAFQQQDVGKLVGISEAVEEDNNGIWEIGAVIEGQATFGLLGVLGDGGDPNGKLLYTYKQTADQFVTVEHLYQREIGLPLALSYSETTPNRIDIVVRLGTDVTGEIESTPSDIISALAADSVISRYISATRPYGAGRESAAGEFPQAPLKRGYLRTDGPFYWALRPFARLVLQGSLPLGTLELDGTDLLIGQRGTTEQPAAVVSAGRTQVVAQSSPFKQGDTGKLLTIRGSRQGNDGTYVIYSVDSGGISAVLDAALNIDGQNDSGLYFGIRTNPTFVPDPTRLNPQAEEVETSAEALLNILAQDFGISVDNQQTDARQRSWVRQVSQWTAVKGTPQAIEGIATLCGFTATATSLNSLPASPSMGSSTAPLQFTLFFVGDVGHYMTAGTLTRVAGFPYFTSASGNFVTGDLGKVLKIANSGRPIVTTNNNYYVIAEVVSSTQVRLLEPSVGANLDAGLNVTLPDPSNGNLQGTVGQLYTGTPPEFPRMDDINFDILTAMYDEAGYPTNDRPGLDVPCDVQPIKIGHDFDGYAKAELDCSGEGSGTYDSVLEAHTAGEDGDNLNFALSVGAGPFRLAYNSGTKTLTATVISGVTTVATVDAAINGLTITNVANALGVIRITTSTPHGMITGEYIEISGVVGTVEANGTWAILSVTTTSFDLIGSYYVNAYISGGTAVNVQVSPYINLKTAGTGATAITAPSYTAALSGGAGNSPPQVVSLDPPTGLVITGVATSGFLQTVTVEGEDLRAVSYPSRTISNVTNNGLGAIRITTLVPHNITTSNSVTVSGVTGATEANGNWVATYVSATQFDLDDSAFGAAYISGGEVLNNDAPLGEWFFVDDTGVTFYMDGLPTFISGPASAPPTPWTWEVQTTATVSPSLGYVYFQYLCPLTISCDYCPSYKVRIDLVAGQVTDEGAVAQENAFERTAARITEVLPAHAEAVYNFVAPFASTPLFAYASGGYSTVP